jgi:hypothetical protein
MNDGALKAALEREERTYEDLLQIRASLGTMLAEAIKREGGFAEFKQRMEDLPLLIRSADIRRTELKVELLTKQLKKAEEEQRRAIEAAKRAAAALEEARRAYASYARAANGEQKWGLEAQRLEELRRKEMARLKRLRSVEPPGDSESAGEGQEERGEQPQSTSVSAQAPSEHRWWEFWR